jgi:uncharacterized radical SAM superfamily protein
MLGVVPGILPVNTMCEHDELEGLMARARTLSWERFGKRITFYHPGMFMYGDEWGKYPAISITGPHCALKCDHCDGKLLEPMLEASSPDALVRKCQRAAERGDKGILLSGGSARDGSLPWGDFLDAIRTVKDTTDLHVSIHSGIVDAGMAGKLNDAGVDQALIDIIGDDGTIKRIYGADYDAGALEDSLAALESAGIPTVPHIIVGLDEGKIKGEYRAIEAVARHRPEAVVIVSFMPLAGTPMADAPVPSPEDIARVMATARLEMPGVPIALGCARERGNATIDLMAVECGVNRVAIPSDEAIAKAGEYGLEIRWEKTCCSVMPGPKDE